MRKIESGELVVVPIFKGKVLSVSAIGLVGENRLCRNKRCDARYKIILGWGYFNVDGKVIPVAAGDEVIIPRGVPFRDSSSEGMVMRSEYVPPFDKKQVEYLE